MKANSKNGMARRGSMRKTHIILINNGIAADANQKVTKTIIYDNTKPKKGRTLGEMVFESFPV